MNAMGGAIESTFCTFVRVDSPYQYTFRRRVRHVAKYTKNIHIHH